MLDPDSTADVWDMGLGKLILPDSIDNIYSYTFEFLVKAGFGTSGHRANLVLSFIFNDPNKSHFPLQNPKRPY